MHEKQAFRLNIKDQQLTFQYFKTVSNRYRLVWHRAQSLFNVSAGEGFEPIEQPNPASRAGVPEENQ
ncbi:MAG: hypothetical protein Q4G70_02650 [Pseudomonadota bacterium]|nr:hypothetical protein [Pseudomonadota bacterium]